MYSLQNQNWYGNWYYPTPKPEETEEEATTKPNYNQNQFVILYLQGDPTSFGSKSILDQNCTKTCLPPIDHLMFLI